MYTRLLIMGISTKPHPLASAKREFTVYIFVFCFQMLEYQCPSYGDFMKISYRKRRMFNYCNESRFLSVITCRDSEK